MSQGDERVFDKKHPVHLYQDKYTSNEKRKYHITGGAAKDLIHRVQCELLEILSSVGEVQT